MTAFDSDVVSLLFAGEKWYVDRAALIPLAELALPVPVLEEVFRGRLHGIRQAESGRGKLSVPEAYEKFRQTVEALTRYRLLAYNDAADALVVAWKKTKIRIGTLDMRVGASCIVNNVKLVSRNRRDFDRLPGLRVEYWDHTAKSAADSANGKGAE
jgi:tRNA(fMet)-specific endonuclease VapC